MRNIWVCGVVLVCLAGCSGPRKVATVQPAVHKPETNRREQRTQDSPSPTAEYAARAWSEFTLCMGKVFTDVAQNQWKGNKDLTVPQTLANACLNSFSQTMKGGINLTSTRIHDVLQVVQTRQEKMIHSLSALRQRMQEESIPFTPGDPGEKFSPLYWDTGMEPCLPVKTSNDAILVAVPIVPAQTHHYLSLRQDEVAAQVLYIDDNMILFLPQNEDPGTTFAQIWRHLLPEPLNITSLVPGTWNALLYEKQFILLDTDKTLSTTELENLKAKYQVAAVVVTNASTFAAFIYTGKDAELPESMMEKYR
jgi:hypothetical protein